MKEVLLSHDSEMELYLVPDDVAEHLRQYCMEFSTWIWESPNAAKLRVDLGNGEQGAMYGSEDFIDYLNEWVFPDQPSRLLNVLDFYPDAIPSEYQNHPCFNF